jgi:hypothetical protein
MSNMFAGCEKLENIYVGDGWNVGDQLTSHSSMFAGCEKLPGWQSTSANDKTNAHTGAGGYLTYKATPTNIPVDIDWNASTKTGTLTMPAGNVEVSVEYYPEAEIDGTLSLSGNNVPATTDEPLIVITGEGTLTGGTMQYAISTDGTKAPSEGWGENMPTAAGITEPGTYYVWYYIKGDDEHSDSEMMGPIAITIGAAPTYSVSLNKEGLNETEVNAWKAKSENVPEVELGSTDLQGVKKGEKVTVTYTGQKKVIGFKVEKKKSYGGL